MIKNPVNCEYYISIEKYPRLQPLNLWRLERYHHSATLANSPQCFGLLQVSVYTSWVLPYSDVLKLWILNAAAPVLKYLLQLLGLEVQ